jgi:hypothetical protein
VELLLEKDNRIPRVAAKLTIFDNGLHDPLVNGPPEGGVEVDLQSAHLFASAAKQ